MKGGSMKDVIVDACEKALDGMLELDCDDAGINRVAFVGWFWGRWWFVTQCVAYDPDPSLAGRFSILICRDTLQAPLDEGCMAGAFGHCEQQVFLGEDLSAEDLARRIREWSDQEA